MTTYFDRVRFYTPTVGAGASVAVGLAFDASFLTPAEAGVVNTDTPDYVIRDGLNVEVGQAVFGAGATSFTRTVTRSKIAGVVGVTPITLSGNAEVFLVDSARLLELFRNNDLTAAAHIANTSNPHATTKAQVGLGSVDNTADSAKPVSTAQAAADAAVQALIPALASTTEVLTGTNTAKAVTPDALAAIWERGPDVTPVAGVATLGEGGYFQVVGSATPITDILFATPKNGREATILIGGVSQVFVHSATLFLPGGIDTTFAPGDQFKVVQTGTTTRRIHSITKYSGTLPASNFASTTEVLTGTDTVSYTHLTLPTILRV